MKVLLFSDIHSDLNALERLLDTPADRYIAAGDLVSWERGLDKVGPLLARRAPEVYVLPGNHEKAESITAFCQRYGLQDFHGKVFDWDGYHFAGLGYSNRTPFHTPGEFTEEQLESKLAPFSTLHPLILVCHCPPKDTPLDRTFGSQAVRDFIDLRQPQWFFCGHIHEAEGVQTTIGATRAVNVGKRGFLLELPVLK